MFNSQIIAILAAILFPVFARAREKAKQTSCLSNVKQLVLGCLMYASDYDDKLPFMASYGVWWWDAISPYTKNTQIVYCPSKPTYLPGYAYNYNGCGYQPGATWSPVRTGPIYEGCNLSIYQSPGPAQTVLLGDNWWGATTTERRALYRDVTRREGRHNDGDNYGFVDGHAKWMMPNEACADADWWDAD